METYKLHAAQPILATKLYIPSPRPNRVPRPRLTARLSVGPHPIAAVTLISAPAGFGKTTLVSEWVNDLRVMIDDLRLDGAKESQIVNPKSKIVNRVAWLSLDEGDNDLARFLAYLVAALQTVAPHVGVGALDLLQSSSPQSLPVEAILTDLLNALAALETGQGFILVLDDYHVITTPAIDTALTFLIEHMPPPMHLVIITREDPSLPLARLRVRGQLTELRAADLRFTAAEAAEFLNRVMGLNLSAADIAALEERTEGWIAGLQLAALSMQNHQDVHGFIKAFTGDNRYIVDYLVEEVLQRQPEPVRRFLLQTAILDRLNGPLCEAVTGRPGGRAQLEALERSNFFVVPLDDKRHWYRYHHLFADVLKVHLLADPPEPISTLHRRASVWYEHNGSPAKAIHHAFAAEDFERAADLVEQAVPAMRLSRQEATLLAWLRALPDALFRDRPVLSVHYAGALLLNGALEGVEARLREAERWLNPAADMPEPAAAHRIVVVDEAEFRRLPGVIAVYRAAVALARGNVTDTVKYAQRALDLLPEPDHLTRGAAAGFLGLAAWTGGDLETAHRMYAEAMARLQQAGHIADAIGCAIALADIRRGQGRLREAMQTYQQALQLAMPPGAATPAVRGMADMHVGLSELHREVNDLNTAIQHLQKSKEPGEHIGLPQNRYRWRVAMARIRAAQGDPVGALDLLDEAERLYVSDFFPEVRPIAALKARVWIAQGRLGEALGWVRAQGLSADDDLSYLREFEHITLARVLLARYQRDRADSAMLEAVGLLERLLHAAEAGARTGSVIEILVLQALAYAMQGNIPAALASLQRALTLAEPEGYIRIFVDEGPTMAHLLREAATGRIMPTYTAKLLESFNDEPPDSEAASPLPSPQPLIEPLSQRELEILRLFNTELSGPEIARELVIALSTVRTHTKGIYSKLNVTSRRAAVKRAEELGLI